MHVDHAFSKDRAWKPVGRACIGGLIAATHCFQRFAFERLDMRRWSMHQIASPMPNAMITNMHDGKCGLAFFVSWQSCVLAVFVVWSMACQLVCPWSVVWMVHSFVASL